MIGKMDCLNARQIEMYNRAYFDGRKPSEIFTRPYDREEMIKVSSHIILCASCRKKVLEERRAVANKTVGG